MDRGSDLPVKTASAVQSGLTDAVVRALQLALCAPAIARCVCTEALLPLMLELIGAALLAVGLALVLGARLGRKLSFVLTLGVYALLALVFAWIGGTAAAALCAFGLAALCVLALWAASAWLSLFVSPRLLCILSQLLSAAVLALALWAVGAKL